MKKFWSFILLFVLTFSLVACSNNNEQNEKLIDDVYSEIVEAIEANNVTSDLNFPTTIDGVTIIYSSSNTSVVDNDGKVTRQETDEEVTITLTLNKDSITVIKKITVVVLKKEGNDNKQIIENAFSKLFAGVDKDNVVSDLSFVTTIDGVNVSYISDKPEVIANDGKVTRQETDQQVIITVALSKGDDTVIKEVSFKVIKKEISADVNEQLIESVFQKLFAGVDKDYVVTNLSFQTTVDGVSISYISDKPNVIANDGKVIRQETDQQVNIIVTLVKDSTIVNKNVTFTVKKAEKVDLTPLKKALESLTNFKVVVKVTVSGDDSGSYTATYDYDDNKIAWEASTGLKYYFVNDTYDAYGLYPDGSSYSKASYYSEEFYDYIYDEGEFDDLYFEGLDYEDFEYQDGYYVVKADMLQSVGKYVIGDYDYEDEEETTTDVFTIFKVKVENNVVTEIITQSTTTTLYNNETYVFIYKYEMRFSKHGDIDISLPDVDDSSSSYDINEIPEVYETENDLSVYTGGNVIGVLGNYVYISNGTQALTLYFDKNSEVTYNNLKLGDYIEVLGIKQEYKGLIEVCSITSLIVKDEKFHKYSPVEVSSIVNITKVANQGTVVNLNNVTIKSNYEPSGTKGDYKFTVTDGTNDILVFIKAVNEKDYNAQLKALKVGDKITLKNFVVSWYNSAQLMAINGSVVTESTGLTISTNVVTVELETELTDALSDITLTYYTENNSKQVAISECSIDSKNYNKSVSGTYVITITYNESTIELKVVVKRAPIDEFKSDDALTLEKVSKQYNVSVGMPSTGNVNVLVFPLSFKNQEVPTNYKSTIEKGFNGTSEETGWESLKTYYQKASYGKLNIQATVMDAYNTNDNYNRSQNYDSALDIDYLHEALAYYDSQIDYSDYDANNDGYIDCIYLVYLAPYNSTNDDSLWWAFTSKDEEPTKYDNKTTDFYMFFSYEFFNEAFIYGETTKQDKYININSQTVIHETGHALGLDDYYDYDASNGPIGGIGGGDMMDYNVGDHNAYSKTILGWVTPTIVQNKNYTATLNSFGASGDAIIVAKEWNNSYFGEYYIIDFYTCDGLNAAAKGTSGLFAVNGIRIYHIDSTLKTTKDSIWEMTQFDNSYTAHKLIKLIEADGGNDIESDSLYETGGYSEDSDLFQANDSIRLTWYDGTFATTIKVDSITSTNATISISFN